MYLLVSVSSLESVRLLLRPHLRKDLFSARRALDLRVSSSSSSNNNTQIEKTSTNLEDITRHKRRQESSNVQKIRSTKNTCTSQDATEI